MTDKNSRDFLEDLRLVPASNLASMLVPMALMGMLFTANLVVDQLWPVVQVEVVPTAPVELRIEITEEGFVIHGARGVFADQSFEVADQEGLAVALIAVAAAFPGEREVTIIPRPRTPYVTIVRTMDTARNVFPYVQITSGE